MNTTLAHLAESELVWFPDRGMGHYPVTEQPYDEAYFAKYQRYADTVRGRAITAARVALVERFAPNLITIDVGIGCGAFAETMPCYGFDINPAGVVWLKDRRQYRDPREMPVDVLTFWDTLEHIPEPRRMLDNARRFVFVSLPIVPGDGPPAPDWKHFRKDEHVWYWTRQGFIWWMAEQGFVCRLDCDVETVLGREDIRTFVFEREAR